MTQATAPTVPKAVRQHSGGLVHAQPRATLRGRHQLPSGGVIKSLCCAAAGINALDLQATTTLAYPMTGVRQAQKLSPPLRSLTRPHAQLVVEYKRPSFSQISLSNLIASSLFQKTIQVFSGLQSTRRDFRRKVVELTHLRLAPAVIAPKLIDKQGQIDPNTVEYPDALWMDIDVKVPAESGVLSLEKGQRRAYVNIAFVQLAHSLSDQVRHLIACIVQPSSMAELSLSTGTQFFPPLPSSLSGSHTPCCNNRHNRTDRLHPCCSDFIPRPTKHDSRPENQNKQQQQPIQSIEITLRARHSPTPCLDQTLSLIISRRSVHGRAP